MSDAFPFRDEDIHHLPAHIVELSFEDDGGWILDIGGGGEGLVGQLKGARVVAIDRLRAELEEAPGEALKCVMDATALQFLDRSFGTVTAFFSIMFIPWGDLGAVFSEASRVLRPGGQMLVWDLQYRPPSEPARPVVVLPLTVVLPDGRRVETGYGARAREQGAEDIVRMGEAHGLRAMERRSEGATFFVRFRKE